MWIQVNVAQGISSSTSSHDTPNVVRTSAPLYSAQLLFRTEGFEHPGLGTSPCAEEQPSQGWHFSSCCLPECTGTARSHCLWVPLNEFMKPSTKVCLTFCSALKMTGNNAGFVQLLLLTSRRKEHQMQQNPGISTAQTGSEYVPHSLHVKWLLQ